MHPIVEEFSLKYTDTDFYKVDVDKNKIISAQQGI